MNDRDLNLDFVKGFLVICMVMYHTITYFTNAGYDGTKYIRFVTGSFIFISGYIVAVYYQKKFEINKKKICERLEVRGLKLLSLFTFINIAINVLGIQSHKLIFYNIESYLTSLYSVYIEGNSIYAVFQIIVPISYLLLLSPILLIFQKWRKTIIIVISILLTVHVALGIASFNLYGLLIGLAGFSVGLTRINHVKYGIKFKSIIIIVFCITVLMFKYFDRNIISYAIGIMIILKLVYDFSKTQDLSRHFNKLIVLLGQYSLVAYFTQILFLQCIYQTFITRRFNFGYEAITIFIITNFFLILLCLLLDLLRRNFRLLDKSYKLIFS